MRLNKEKIASVLSKFPDKNILVIGDIMVDAYYWGKTERISPEAPVPIVEVDKTNFNPGGAGNVALNLSTLGAKVSVIAIVGKENEGRILINQLNESAINTSKILSLDEYKTPIKIRVIAHDQQIVRIDQEKNSIKINKYFVQIEQKLEKGINEFDGIIIADYNKGLLSKKIITLILSKAKKNSIPVYVDPKNDNFFEYNNLRLFKPNESEFKNAVVKKYSEIKIVKSGEKYLRDSDSDLLLITRGAKDSILFTKNENTKIPTMTQSVHDVSGAGDTVISVFTLADLSGSEPVESATIANVAAGIVCSKVGVVPIQIKELKSKLLA
jgi:rfaE bifunctional protein kinase chain/domain